MKRKKGRYQLLNIVLILFAFLLLNVQDHSAILIHNDTVRLVLGFVITFVALISLMGSDWIFHHKSKK